MRFRYFAGLEAGRHEGRESAPSDYAITLRSAVESSAPPLTNATSGKKLCITSSTLVQKKFDLLVKDHVFPR
jgi:hypothetical protein